MDADDADLADKPVLLNKLICVKTSLSIHFTLQIQGYTKWLSLVKYPKHQFPTKASCFANPEGFKCS